ncbi:PREDICTED: mitochondrial import receptor subunit TOM20-4 [Camelina sativa]|uniref:Mitochondrial import receptor subunit TOM20-4 n=1 Tax=Camelina sativa TaxID=90675 RepID=A0ABM0U5A3_CAMSA|nr:PREDICTED: mitochondrial import receptor subunit TOM20-4 [Camelina sativa]
MDMQSGEAAMDMQSEIERLVFFEHARKLAEATYIKNPLDVDNLTRWGGALLEVAQFQQITESKQLILEAISKLGEALLIDPKKHDALWVIGNAHVSYGFLTPDQTEAIDHFENATQFFQRALEEQPGNESYQKSLEMASKAPVLHTEVYKHGSGPQPLGGVAGPSSSSNAKFSQTMKQKKNSDFKYDVLGWVILAAGVVAWFSFAKSQMPVPRQ